MIGIDSQRVFEASIALIEPVMSLIPEGDQWPRKVLDAIKDSAAEPSIEKNRALCEIYHRMLASLDSTKEFSSRCEHWLSPSCGHCFEARKEEPITAHQCVLKAIIFACHAVMRHYNIGLYAACLPDSGQVSCFLSDMTENVANAYYFACRNPNPCFAANVGMANTVREVIDLEQIIKASEDWLAMGKVLPFYRK